MAGHPLNYEPYPSVNPTGAPGGDTLRIDARPEAFGAATGRALVGLGQGLEKASGEGFATLDLQAQMDARTHAAELHSWQSDQVTDEQEKFLGLRGKAALEALPAFKQKISDIHEQARDQAGNPFTAQLVDTQGRRLTDITYAGAARHAASQRATWEATTAKDAAASYGNQAALAAVQTQAPAIGDDVNVQRYLANSDQEHRNLAEGQGYDGPAIEQEVARNRGANVKNIVEQIAGDGSPTGLKRAFDFYKAQEEKIDAGSRLQIQNFLKGPLNTIAGQKIADDVIGRPQVPQKPLEIASRFVGAEENAQRETLSKFIGTIGGKTVDPATTAWCAAFVNGVLREAGLQGSGSLMARSFLNFGQAVEGKPQEGDVVVLPRGNPADGLGHVGFYAGPGAAPGTIRILAGNTNNRVAYADYPASSVLGIRRMSAADIGQTPQIDAVAGKPLLNKGDAMLRIMNDPNLANRPQVQAAALARINHVYEAYNLQATQDTAAFQLRVRNATAEGLETGRVTQPIGREEFYGSLGATEGEKAFTTYQANVQLGADMRSTAGLAPDQIAEMRARYAPQPGDTYIEQGKRLATLDRAIAENEKLKGSDPAAFLISRTDTGNEAYRQFHALTNDQNVTPELRRNYAAIYADKMLAEQARLGIDPADRRILPQSYVDRINTAINTPSSVGGSLNAASLIANEANLWGSHWPEVSRQIQGDKKTSPELRVIATGIDPSAAALLVENKNLTPQAILKDTTDEKYGLVQKAVRDVMKPFAQTLRGKEGGDALFHDFEGQAQKLTAHYVAQGQTSTEAAERSFNELLGAKYNFDGALRIPKRNDDGSAFPYTVGDIQRGTEVASGMIGDFNLKVPADTFGGLSEEYLAKASASTLAREGVWVTAPGDAGVGLVWKGRVVEDKTGQPFVLSWDWLGQRAKAAPAMKLDAAPPEFMGGEKMPPMPSPFELDTASPRAMGGAP